MKEEGVGRSKGARKKEVRTGEEGGSVNPVSVDPNAEAAYQPALLPQPPAPCPKRSTKLL